MFGVELWLWCVPSGAWLRRLAKWWSRFVDWILNFRLSPSSICFPSRALTTILLFACGSITMGFPELVKSETVPVCVPFTEIPTIIDILT